MLGLKTVFAALCTTALGLLFPEKAAFYAALFFVVCIAVLGSFVRRPSDKKTESKDNQ